MLKNHHKIAKKYMELKVINRYHKSLTNELDCFLFNVTSFLCLSGFELIKKSFYESLTLILILNDDESIVFHSTQNDGAISVILKIKMIVVRVTFQLQK